MDKRLYPVSQQLFNKDINPIIETAYSAAGKPKKISNYQVFCATCTYSGLVLDGEIFQNATDTGIAFI